MRTIKKLSYYQLLDVDRVSSPEKIKSAYRECVKKFHPDLCQNDENVDELEIKIRENILKQINDAYETLTDFYKSCQYDSETSSEEMSERERYYYDCTIIQEIDKCFAEEKIVDFYSLLGVSPDATTAEIENAFFERITAYHPDLPINNLASPEVKALNEDLYNCMKTAYTILTNNEKKAAYDKVYNDTYVNNKEETGPNKKEKNSKRKNTESKQRYSDVKTKSFVETVKEGWKEVRADEKTEPFKERHKNVKDHIDHSSLASANSIIYHIGSGAIHVCCETWFQLYKLRYITEDNLPKFIIRNRVTLGSILLAGALILVPKSSDSKDVTPDTMPSEPSVTQSVQYDTDTKTPGFEDDSITLNRVHSVEYGDTVSEYSKESNSTVEYIAKVNGLEVNYDNSVNIKAGDKIVIPYIIDQEDLSYYTASKKYTEGMPLQAFASINETDINTLLLLNPEAIEVTNENSENPTYHVASDTLTVPEFLSKSEYKDIKTQTEAYVKTNGNN